MAAFYAHSFVGKNESEWEPLEDHLLAVAALARDFASVFDSGDFGWLLGLWHDLGKYHPSFRALLNREITSFGHAVYGAQMALRELGKDGAGAKLLAAIIAGHHGGLRDQPELQQRYREQGKDLDTLLPVIPPHIATLPALRPPAFLRAFKDDESSRRQLELWGRFLYSALVDADSLATEDVYENGKRRRVLGRAPDLESLRQRLHAFLEAKSATARPSEIQNLRSAVLAACRTQAAEKPGFFSLTVPTGGGKTFSSLSFALEHATRHGLRRVISIIPFTSILEQTAEQYRLAIGEESLIEHHSGLDPDTESLRNLMASENWDAPVVLSTGVQFFESLFARSRSRCRKLHNIARSVILLDEAQTLPTEFLNPVLDVLQTLVSSFGCTVLFSTATQPALNRSSHVPTGIEGVREIVADPVGLARAFVRYRVRWPEISAPPTSWPELAAELAMKPQVLAIVHQRQDAKDLAGLLPAEGLFHLSANLCAAHRSEVIAEVKGRLQAGATCRLVSTQVVEAGVDIDFPVVYRALAGLDSLVQSGGRCNREGRLPEPGTLHVFRASTEPPRGVLRHGLEKMERLLKERGAELQITDPEIVTYYFRLLYRDLKLDPNGIQAQRKELAYQKVAEKVRLIENDWQVGVVVPWGEGEKRLERLKNEGPNRRNLRALQPYLVNVAKCRAQKALNAGLLENVHDLVFALTAVARELYHPTFGLDLEAPISPGNLMV